MENDRQDTLARLMEEHGDRLYRLCLLLLRDPHLAEDAVQDTMLKAWRGLDSFEARASEKTWLTAIDQLCHKLLVQHSIRLQYTNHNAVCPQPGKSLHLPPQKFEFVCGVEKIPKTRPEQYADRST